MSTEKTITENKVLVTKIYKIAVVTFDDGTTAMTRSNDGFTPLELIGLADFIAIEVREQIMGNIKPDTIKREVLV